MRYPFSSFKIVFLPFYSNIEIPLNGGLDYISSGKTFAYWEKKAVLYSLNPVEGQVTGNTKININYGSPGVNSSWLDILDIEEGALKLTLINLWGNWGVRGY